VLAGMPKKGHQEGGYKGEAERKLSEKRKGGGKKKEKHLEDPTGSFIGRRRLVGPMATKKEGNFLLAQSYASPRQ